MSAEASSRLAQWWVHGVNALDRAQPLVPAGNGDAWSAAAATRAVRWVQQLWREWSADGQPRSVDELVVYARHIERDMPGLAADLRAAALRHQDSAG
ncbi:MAG: hypothetical protein V4792_02150 [Pseudomonadota bacterium]